MDGDCKRKSLARPALFLRDGLQPQAEPVADTHGQGNDNGAADQYLGHGEVSGRGVHPDNVTKAARFRF